MKNITAHAPIRIYANVVGKEAVRIGDQVAFKPTNSQQWVSLRKGEVRDDISIVIGLDPRLFPEMDKICVGLNEWVIPYSDQEAFRDLLQVE